MVISDQQKQCVIDALSSPDALEQWLTENLTRNVGYVGLAHSCPIQRFLADTCPDIKRIEVLTYTVCLLDNGDNSTDIPTPFWVKMFVSKVDYTKARWIKGSTGLRYLREIKEEVDA